MEADWSAIYNEYGVKTAEDCGAIATSFDLCRIRVNTLKYYEAYYGERADIAKEQLRMLAQLSGDFGNE